MESEALALQGLFPETKKERIVEALKRTGGNMEAAIDILLSPESPAVPLKPNEAQPLSEDDDFLFAKKLQEELLLEEKGQNVSDESMAKHFTQEEDEALAHQLMMNEMQGSYSNTVPKYQPPSNAIGLDAMDETIVNELLNQVKSNFLPLIKQQLQGFKVPDVAEEFDAGTFGEVALTITNISMSEVEVAADGISMFFEKGVVQLVVKNVRAKLDEFGWSYEKKTGFPKLKDSGKGNAAVSGVTLKVSMTVGISHTGPTLNVQSSTVTIDKLDLKISGTGMSLLYNLVLGVFKKTIKRTIESSIASMLSSAISGNMEDLLDFD